MQRFFDSCKWTGFDSSNVESIDILPCSDRVV